LEATNLMVASAVDFVVHLGLDNREHRVVASVREVIDADGPQVTTNEIFRPDAQGCASPGVPLRTETLDALMAAGFDPAVLEPSVFAIADRGRWDR
jgi:hypothetical protein